MPGVAKPSPGMAELLVTGGMRLKSIVLSDKSGSSLRCSLWRMCDLPLIAGVNEVKSYGGHVSSIYTLLGKFEHIGNRMP